MIDRREAFMQSFSRSEVDCWEWTGYIYKTGYGCFNSGGKKYQAHRASWMFFVGKIPDGLFVLHSCDNPKCVNPSHLFLGTQADNVADMIAKGRNKIAVGEEHSCAKLTAADVRMIRTSALSNAELAEKFGMTHQAISSARSGYTWKSESTKPRSGRRQDLMLACKHGHPWTPQSSRIRENGVRQCRICHALRERSRRTAASLVGLSS